MIERQMVKLLDVTTCVDCLHSDYVKAKYDVWIGNQEVDVPGGYFCFHPSILRETRQHIEKRIPYGGDIPIWCPLPDKEKQGARIKI